MLRQGEQVDFIFHTSYFIQNQNLGRRGTRESTMSCMGMIE